MGSETPLEAGVWQYRQVTKGHKNMSTENKKWYVAVDAEAIWGVGNTPENAMKDAMEWVYNDFYGEYNLENISPLPATESLVAQVEFQGGEIAWGQGRDGKLCTLEEEENAQDETDND